MYFIDNENVIAFYCKYFWILLVSVKQLLLNYKISADVLMQTLLLTTLVYPGVTQSFYSIIKFDAHGCLPFIGSDHLNN